MHGLGLWEITGEQRTQQTQGGVCQFMVVSPESNPQPSCCDAAALTAHGVVAPHGGFDGDVPKTTWLAHIACDAL